jgi:hypothetical protein
MAEAGIEQTGESSEKRGIPETTGADSGAVPPASAGLADLARLLAGLTPEQIQALMALAQTMTGKPQAAG